ncbi:MAG: hypothetical protein INR69_21500, partial [Mucilaginibacter polytrichastri]|nr:hypothetical protein [Mucilaginibacter polytrichastri]
MKTLLRNTLNVVRCTTIHKALGRAQYAILIALICAGFSACQKHDFAEGELSPITAIEDVQALHKGSDVALTSENLNGARQITGVVISDASSGNTPSGILVIQNYRRKKLRGIALNIGASATKFLPGDSLLVNITGG